MNKIPVSVLVPTKNEINNLKDCLSSVNGWADEVIVVDSQSTDGTIEVAHQYGAEVQQLHYNGGWPKKKQWALDNLNFKNNWILLLDADESLMDGLKNEIEESIKADDVDGFYIGLEVSFLNKRLKYGGFKFHKLCLFRKGKGHFEKLLEDQDFNISDVEVHEHLMINGKIKKLKNCIKHNNKDSLYRFIKKHNEYSTWDAKLLFSIKCSNLSKEAITPKLFSKDIIQRLRWLKIKLFPIPGFPAFVFFYHYIIRLGFLDGSAGFCFAIFKAIQRFQIKMKLKELELNEKVK